MEIREDIIYARQSVDRVDSISIESQIEFCKYETRGEQFKEYKDKGYSGKNITIAILDTGIAPINDFVYPKNRIMCFKDFINNKTEPYDDNGHGTHLRIIKIHNKKHFKTAY